MAAIATSIAGGAVCPWSGGAGVSSLANSGNELSAFHSAAPSACASVCPNGETAGTYVFVNAQYPYTSVMPYSVLGSQTTLTAQASVRIQ